jgi:hypothetical protein
MLGQTSQSNVGSVKVVTTNKGGLSIDYWAERCLNKIVYVAEESGSIFKEQAMAFKSAIRLALLYYIEQAIKSDRTTQYSMLLKHGETKAAELIRRL